MKLECVLEVTCSFQKLGKSSRTCYVSQSVQQSFYWIIIDGVRKNLGFLSMKSRFEEATSPSFMSKKRSDIDIMANILDEARKGARKNRLMYRSNMSHKQLRIYLALLLGLELLALHSNFYRTTAKGLKFLDAYQTLKVLMT